jgi:nucleoside-triphosphatase THEP1
MSSTPDRATNAPVTLLTGARGEGKSAFCRELLRIEGVAGLVSLPREDSGGARWGFDAVVFPGEQRFPLARVIDPGRWSRRASENGRTGYELTSPPEDDSFDPATVTDGIALGPYLFSAEAIRLAGEALLQVAGQASTRLVVVDEIGPLELGRGEGLIDPLRQLLRGETGQSPRPLLVVVRASLVVTMGELVGKERPACTLETVVIRDFDELDQEQILRMLV